MRHVEGFDPILCFARNDHQTVDEVFDMLQERMMTLLGKVYIDNGVGICYFVDESQASKEEIATILDWQTSSILLSPGDFERMGGDFGLTMLDVLGHPKISDAIKKVIASKFKPQGDGTIDPVQALVTFAAFDKIDEMVKERKSITEAHREVA